MKFSPGRTDVETGPAANADESFMVGELCNSAALVLATVASE